MLRKIFFSAFCLAAALPAAATEANDTIVNIQNARHIVFSETDSLLSLRIEGQNADSTYSFEYHAGRRRMSSYSSTSKQNEAGQEREIRIGKMRLSSKEKNQLCFGGINVGFVSALNAPEGMETDMASSIEVNLEPLAYRWYTRSKKQYFSLGIGFGWRNYRLTNRTRFVKNEQENIIVTTYPDEASRTRSSRIKTFSVTVPFRYTFLLGKNWKADVAAILDFTPYASAQSRYEVEDAEMIPGETVTHDVTDFSKNIHQQKVTVDFMAQLHWRRLGVYAKYSPCHVLNTSYGPKFSPLSVGLSIFY